VAQAYALAAAVAFAIGLVLQQRGTMDAGSGSDGGRWLVEILHKPVWLAGGILQATGWVLQARALDLGPLVVVQSLTTLSLVIALPFGAWLTGQRITRSVVGGAAAVVAGIVLFLSVGAPSGGTTNPSASEWWTACLVTLGLVLSIGRLGQRRTGSTRALLFGAAAGFGFALQTSVTKVFVTQIGGGLLALLANWSVYVLILSAVAGFVLQQSALKTGALAPAMASSNSVTLFAGVVLGITVFDETLQSGGGNLVPAIIGLGLAVVGVFVLGGSPDADADGRTSGSGAPGSGASDHGPSDPGPSPTLS
jgi:drug/metabolite transporter (DMT)-like permease